MEAGPIRIIEVQSGMFYCDECYNDITGGDASTDNDFTMHTVKRLLDGICECCGIVVDHGNTPAD